MNARRVAWLLGAAVVVIAVALWLSTRQSDRPAEAGNPVVPALKDSLNSVSEVRIIKGDGTRTTLKKREKDWVVAERGFPADSGQVRKLLIDLADLSVVEEKTSNPKSYAQLGLEDVNSDKATGTRIEVVMPEKTLGLIVGKQSGTKSSFVRVADAQQSLLASPLIHADADPKRWLDRSAIDLPQDRVKEVAVAPAEGPAYIITRANKEQTDFTVEKLPKGRELSSPGAVNPIASSLTALMFDDVRKAGGSAEESAAATATAQKTSTAGKAQPKSSDPKADRSEGQAKATFRTFDGLTVDVIGLKDGDRHFVTLQAQSTAKETEAEAQKLNERLAGWELEIPAYKYDAIFRPLEDSLATVEKADKKSS